MKWVSIKSFHLLIVILLLSACSVLPYAPVVVTSSLGLHQTDLSEKHPYKKFIGRAIKLSESGDKTWQLKKFKDGRYYIALSNNSRNYVCQLRDGTVVINKVFSDTINHGIFYDAHVTCLAKQYRAPLNHWVAEISEAAPL